MTSTLAWHWPPSLLLKMILALESAFPAVVPGFDTVMEFAAAILCLGAIRLYCKHRISTSRADLETRLQLATDAQEDMIHNLPFAAASFNSQLKLLTYNRLYSELWNLSPDWLETRPSYGDILDCLRDERKIPEQRNFSEWKQAQLQNLGSLHRHSKQTWHLSNGDSIILFSQPLMQGGVFVIFENITEKLHLEASLNLLSQVQKATLDTLDEGFAIFGMDGVLLSHNPMFAKMWKIGEAEFEGALHFTDIARISAMRIGEDEVWNLVSAAINSIEPERSSELATVVRADGHILSLASSRLPNGATIIRFSDLTDLVQFKGEVDHAAA